LAPDPEAGDADGDAATARVIADALAAGATPDPPEAFGIPLHAAAAARCAAGIRALLAAGADVNRANRAGMTALYVAVAVARSGEVVRLLAGAGASFVPGVGAPAPPRAAGDGGDAPPAPPAPPLLPGGRTLLHLAALQDESEDGALVAAVLDGRAAAGKGGAAVDEPDGDGVAPLAYAAAAGNTGAVRVLITAGAAPGSAGGAADSHSAATAALESAFAAAEAAGGGITGRSAAEGRAALSRAIVTLGVLYDAGAALADEPTVSMEPLAGGPVVMVTPLSAVCGHPALEGVVPILIRPRPGGRPPAVDATRSRNSDGSTPLEHAVECGNVSVVTALLAAGATITPAAAARAVSRLDRAKAAAVRAALGLPADE
jgi:ankyrin repeat protein